MATENLELKVQVQHSSHRAPYALFLEQNLTHFRKLRRWRKYIEHILETFSIKTIKNLSLNTELGFSYLQNTLLFPNDVAKMSYYIR